jgi:glycosyltransferase involved in cell wall biosynthesis
MASVGILTNTPSPYRLPVFEEIAKKHSLTVYFTGTGRDLDSYYNSQSPESWSFEPVSLSPFSIGPIATTPGLVRELRRRSHDVVILGDNPSNLPGTLIGTASSQFGGARSVIWTEGIDTPYKQGSWLRYAFDQFRRGYYRVADLGLGYSGAAAEFLHRRGMHRSDIVTGHQVMPASLLPTPEQTDVESEQIRVLSLGELRRRKAVYRVITAVMGHSNIELIIAGDGPEKENLEQIAADADNVTFRGHVTPQEKANLYATADVFCLPTSHDAWGLVVNEAIYYGTPVVVSEWAGSAALVEETGAGKAIIPTSQGLLDALETVAEDEKFEQAAIAAKEKVSDPEVGSRPFLNAIEALS